MKKILPAIGMMCALASSEASAKTLEVINQVNQPVFLYFRCLKPVYTVTSIGEAKSKDHPSKQKFSVGEEFAKCNEYEVIAYTKEVDDPDWTLTSGKCSALHTDKHEQIKVDAIGNDTVGNLKITCTTLSHR